VQLAKLGPGSVLGELALLTGTRSATAVAAEEVELFELARRDVEELARGKPQIAEELLDYCRKRLIGALVQTSPLFKRFDEATRYLLVDEFQRKGFKPGSKIIKQGEPGSGLYVVATGEVEVSVSKDGGEPVVVANLSPGDVFGEISLLRDQPTTATVTARDSVGALFLPKAAFQQVLAEPASVREYLQSLSDDRVKATEAVQASAEVLDADELIVL
ncbi:MAG: cyclic nucleotide-binding domain-containing protein, partial [Deltaproteobacteria bacterium]|nr:cyclic nucleotide-binding domain-containing protein [Deltaproteobacteria bacterium]